MTGTETERRYVVVHRLVHKALVSTAPHLGTLLQMQATHLCGKLLRMRKFAGSI